MDYLDDIGAGAIFVGAALGQQDAARNEAAAATMMNLTMFMVIFRWLVSVHSA
jgi:hypothetical protein